LNFRYIEYKGVQFTDYEIVYATFYSLAFRCGVDSSTFARVKSELSSSSNVHFGVFDLENQRIINLKAHKITAEKRRKNSVVFEISNYEYSRLSKIKFSQIILFEGLRFDISESFEIQSRGLLLKTNSSLFNNDTETIHFDYFDENFDFERPYLYHKEQIYSNQRLINILKLKIFDPKVTDFIKNIGIAHLFEKYIPELSKGFVIKSRPDGFYVYDLKRKNIIFSTALSLSSSIPLGSCVNIECDNSISLTSPSTLGDSFFKEGVIVKISSDGDLTEGFIRSGNTKDFYFNNYFSDSYNLFQKCLVKFIPGLNYRFKQTVHSLLALCVRIDYSKYSISKVTFFDTHQVENELIYVELFDILTCEKLFTKYNSSFPIHQFDGQFRLGQHFIYSKRLKQRHKAMTYIRLDRYLGLTL